MTKQNTPEAASERFSEELQDLLNLQDSEKLLQLFKTSGTEELLEKTSWNLVPIIAKHLTEENLTSKPDFFSACEELLEIFAEKCNPAETVLLFLEQAENLGDDVRFRALLKPLATSLKRGDLSKTIEWVVSSIRAYVEEVPVPENINPENAVPGEHQDAEERLVDTLHAILQFLSQIVAVSLEKERLTPDDFRIRTNLLNLHLNLFDKPFSHLKIDFEEENLKNDEKLENGEAKSLEDAEKGEIQEEIPKNEENSEVEEQKTEKTEEKSEVSEQNPLKPEEKSENPQRYSKMSRKMKKRSKKSAKNKKRAEMEEICNKNGGKFENDQKKVKIDEKSTKDSKQTSETTEETKRDQNTCQNLEESKDEQEKQTTDQKSSKTSETSETSKKSPFDTKKSSVFRSLLHQTLQLHPNPLILFEIIKNRIHNRVNLLNPEADKNDVHNLETQLLNTEVSTLAYGSFFFTLFTSNFHQNLPQVYNPHYLMICGFFLSNELLKKPEYVLVSKGLTLVETSLNRVDDESIPLEALESSVVTELFKNLSQVMIFCDSSTERQLSLKVFRIFIEKFTMRGRYRVIWQLYETSNHSGLLGLVISILKTSIITCLERKNCEDFLGRKAEAILRRIFKLPNGSASDLVELSDEVIAALNLLRFLVIRDKENETGVWNLVGDLRDGYLKELKEGVDLARAHWKVKVRDLEANKGEREAAEVEVVVGGERIQGVDVQGKVRVCYQAMNALDVVESVVSRVVEIIEANLERVV